MPNIYFNTQVGRRLELRVEEGDELQLLRNHAMSRKRSFLLPLSALPGMHPLGDTQEWEYTQEVREQARYE